MSALRTDFTREETAVCQKQVCSLVIAAERLAATHWRWCLHYRRPKRIADPATSRDIVRALIETLGSRHIGVVHDEYAVSSDGMKMFGVLDLATEMEGCRFSTGAGLRATGRF
jgi:hypothetical protein